jgi:hypothetical protein
MTAAQITVLGILEAVGLFLILRLWCKIRLPVARKIVWSLLLLIPVLGPLMYGFVSLDPEPHGEDVGDFSAGGGGVGDSGHHP